MRARCLATVLVAGSAALLAGAAALAQDLPRGPTVDDEIRALAANAPLKLAFHGKTAEQCRQWQAAFRARLRSLLGPHQPPAKWHTTVERVVERGDHRREELLLTAEGHPPLPVYVLVPLGKSAKPRPGILALHGHGKYGYDPVAGCDDRPGVAKAIASCNYDYGRQLVRKGYVVVVPCLTPFGRRLGKAESYGKQDACAITFVRMQLLGKVLMAENLRDCAVGAGIARAPQGRRSRAAWLRRPLLRRADDDAHRCPGAAHQGRRRFRGAQRDAGAHRRAL